MTILVPYGPAPGGFAEHGLERELQRQLHHDLLIGSRPKLTGTPSGRPPPPRRPSVLVSEVHL